MVKSLKDHVPKLLQNFHSVLTIMSGCKQDTSLWATTLSCTYSTYIISMFLIRLNVDKDKSMLR